MKLHQTQKNLLHDKENEPQGEKATCGKGGNIYQLYIWKGAPEYIIFHSILYYFILHYIIFQSISGTPITQ